MEKRVKGSSKKQSKKPLSQEELRNLFGGTFAGTQAHRGSGRSENGSNGEAA